MPISKRTANICIVIMLSIASASCDYFDDTLNESYKPVINNSPQHLLKIHGKIDPSINLVITTKYLTTNKKCSKTVNWLEGVKSKGTHRIDHPVNSKEGLYEVLVEYETLLPGDCQWKIFSIEYSLSKNNIERKDHLFPTTLIRFTAEPSHIPDFSIECDFSMTMPSGSIVPCRKPLGRYYLDVKQKTLNVDFIERKWLRTKRPKLNNLTWRSSSPQKTWQDSILPPIK